MEFRMAACKAGLGAPAAATLAWTIEGKEGALFTFFKPPGLCS